MLLSEISPEGSYVGNDSYAEFKRAHNWFLLSNIRQDTESLVFMCFVNALVAM